MDDQQMLKNASVLSAMFDDIAIVNPDQVMIYVSDGFERNYHITREKIIGMTMDEIEKERIFYPSVAKAVFDQKKKLIMGHRNKIGNYTIICGIPIFQDGKVAYCISYAVPSDEINLLQKEKEALLEQLEDYQAEYEKLQSQLQHIKEDMTVLTGSKKTMQSIRKIKDHDVSVLFMGESGVGKTVYSRFLHENGPRADKPFIEISCGAIPENLLESELFGYREGSFTGASKEGKVGLVEAANGGTLFLDEIGELPLNLQSKILQAIQEKRIMKIGDTEEIPVDFRLITATNKDLKAMVEEGTFREDLFYRINVITIEIPPLRDRPDDMVTLIKFFLDKFNSKYGENRRISRECVKRLSAYSWPGNIRELENTIERMVILAEGGVIMVEDLPDHISEEYDESRLMANFEGRNLQEIIDKFEGKVINKAFKKYKTSVDLAKHLGISQPTATRKIKKYVKE